MNNIQLNKQDWTVTHHKELLTYQGEWVLYSNALQKIVAHNNSLVVAKKQAIDVLQNEDFTFFYMKPDWGRRYYI